MREDGDMATKLTIIGAGPGGYVAAIRAAQQGAQVTLIEGSAVGGTCLNWGCIPTKAILASAESLLQARNASAFGIDVSGDVTYSLDRIRERKNKIVATQVKGIMALLKSWGVYLIPGRGSLISPDVVRVVQEDGTTMDINSDNVIIATGSRPARMPVFPFDGTQVITSDEAVLLKTIPKSLCIVGAGVIGSEFAFIYRAFGAQVTMVEMAGRALSTEDEEISELIERELKKAGIKLLTGVSVQGVSRDSDNMLVSTLSSGQQIRTEMMLVSTGRILNSENLGLEDVGIATGKQGEIMVNEKMETSVPGIFAIGDVTGKILLAHVASSQALAAVDNALGGNTPMDYSAVPAGIFTMPEIGSVGLREKQAAESGIRYTVGRFPFRALGRAHTAGEIAGLVKIIAEEGTDRVLGMHVCGAHAADLIHEGVLAIQARMTVGQLERAIHAHPTFAEAIREAAEDVHGHAIHVPAGSRGKGHVAGGKGQG
jgi:dihydrolipoamide dehydrogenase